MPYQLFYPAENPIPDGTPPGEPPGSPPGDGDGTPPGNNGWGWHLPTTTTKISGYTYGESHHGIDLGTVVNTPIYAVDSGFVSFAGLASSASAGYGNLIVLQTDTHNAKVYYAHLNTFSVITGQIVKKGQLLGYTGGAVGSAGAGSSSGPHLHFEIRNRSGGYFSPFDVFPGVYPGSTVGPSDPNAPKPPPEGTPGSPTTPLPPSEPPPNAEEEYWKIISLGILGDIYVPKPHIPWANIALIVTGLGFVMVGIASFAKETGVVEKAGQAAAVVATGGVV